MGSVDRAVLIRVNALTRKIKGAILGRVESGYIRPAGAMGDIGIGAKAKGITAPVRADIAP